MSTLRPPYLPIHAATLLLQQELNILGKSNHSGRCRTFDMPEVSDFRGALVLLSCGGNLQAAKLSSQETASPRITAAADASLCVIASSALGGGGGGGGGDRESSDVHHCQMQYSGGNRDGQ